MPTQQPYIEAPEDVFNPVVNQFDWLELITSDSSPGGSSFSDETQEATSVGYIPWNKQRSALAYFLGFALVNSAGTMHRKNKESHGIFPWLYCSDVAFKAFNPQVNPNPTGSGNPFVRPGPIQFVSPWYQNSANNTVSLLLADHTLAVCNLKFRNYRCSFLDDSFITDPRMEWMRNVYTEIDPTVEALSASGIGQLMFAETGPAGPPAQGPVLKTPFPAPVAELLGKSKFSIFWFGVPYFYLTTVGDFFFPNNIMDCLGCTNSQPFPYGSSDPFPVGTLLFDAVKFKQKTFALAPADPSSPLLSIDVEMSMKYFNPPLGATAPLAQGHNCMPYRGKSGDPTSGLFFYATRGGGTTDRPLLYSADFNQMFAPAT